MTDTILLFSGGKDSRLLLDMYKDQLDEITVVWVDTNDSPPEDVHYVVWALMEVPFSYRIRSMSSFWIDTYGHPVDVLPVSHTPEGQVGRGPAPIKLQPYTACCNANLWGPLADYIKKNNVKRVITGQRGDELMRNHLRDGPLTQLNGIEWVQPLHDWTAEQVFDELKRRGIPLLPSYLKGSPSSISCSRCTAYLEKGKGRLQALPIGDRAEVVRVLKYVAAALDKERGALTDFIEG